MASSSSSSSSSSDLPVVLSGHCYCGSVCFSVPRDVEPHVSAYCHCESCRRAHSSPLYQVIYVKPEYFQVTSGQEFITEFCKPGSACSRSFCSQCGSRVLNRLHDRPDWLGFFPALFDEEIQHNLPSNLVPKFQYYPSEAVLDPKAACGGLPGRN